MTDLFDNLPTDNEYRAQFIERTGREPMWIPTGWKKLDGEYRRMWAHNKFSGRVDRDY